MTGLALCLEDFSSNLTLFSITCSDTDLSILLVLCLELLCLSIWSDLPPCLLPESNLAPLLASVSNLALVLVPVSNLVLVLVVLSGLESLLVVLSNVKLFLVLSNLKLPLAAVSSNLTESNLVQSRRFSRGFSVVLVPVKLEYVHNLPAVSGFDRLVFNPALLLLLVNVLNPVDPVEGRGHPLPWFSLAVVVTLTVLVEHLLVEVAGESPASLVPTGSRTDSSHDS